MIFSWQIILMIVISILFISWFLYRPIKETLSDDDSNIQINKQRQNELISDKSIGLIEEQYFKEAENEIIGTLASELKSNESKNFEIKPLIWVVSIAVFIAIISLSLYSQLAPKIIPNASDNSSESFSMDESLDALKEYLVENPDDFSAWLMLGMAQAGIGDVDDSIISFENAFKINSNDIDLLLQYATALSLNQDGAFIGAPKELIEKALTISPQSEQVLYFAGIVAAQEANFDLARDYWEKALYIMPDSHPDRGIIEEALETISNLQVK